MALLTNTPATAPTRPLASSSSSSSNLTLAKLTPALTPNVAGDWAAAIDGRATMAAKVIARIEARTRLTIESPFVGHTAHDATLAETGCTDGRFHSQEQPSDDGQIRHLRAIYCRTVRPARGRWAVRIQLVKSGVNRVLETANYSTPPRCSFCYQMRRLRGKGPFQS